MATTDGGMHWKKLSPDLGYPKGVTPPPPGSTPAGGRGGAGGAPPAGSIESISPSSVAGGTIWVGTNNGLIKVTRDHGATWDDVTIPGSAATRRAPTSRRSTRRTRRRDARTSPSTIHGIGDYKPYFYRTHDYGKTWTKIVNGLRGRSAERQLRARDPRRHEEAGAALRRHRELDVRLVRRRRQLAVAAC